MSEYRNIVIVGASLAGLRAAEGLRREGYGGQITMLGDEPENPYDRPPLSKEVLTGERSHEDIKLPKRFSRERAHMRTSNCQAGRN